MLETLSSSDSRKSACIFAGFVLICFCVNTSSAWSAPPSPAGGNYLALDGQDDYAFLDFGISGVLFGEGDDDLTIEAWIYPTFPPDDDEIGTILSQQIVIYTMDWKGDLLFDTLAYVPPFGGGNICAYTGSPSMAISPYEWHHIAFQMVEGRMMSICDGLSKSGGSSGKLEQNLFKECIEGKRSRGDLVVGGYGGKFKIAWPFDLWGSFAGCIDEVRISTVPRYDVSKKHFIPEGRFEPDAKTIALWHFDEPAGATLFLDSSRSKYHLVGMNGAVALAVSKSGKLATTWGAMKGSDNADS